MLAHLDDAWKDFFAGKAGQPGFKVKDRDTMSIEEPSKICWRLDARKNCLRFPKLGNVPLTLHQPLEGTPKTCSLVRDVDQWFAHITCEIEVPESTHEPSPSVIAIDLGVEVAFADSSGRLVPNPRLGEALAPTLAKRQRQLAKKQKGSNNRKKEKVKVAKVHRKLRRQRENFLHTWSHRYAKNHSVVVIEDLKLKNMTRSARGTESEPGRNVAQKAGLNRALLDVAPGRFASMLEYKTERHGGVVEHVPAAYSSQECSVCGHVASENRPTRSRFCCMACGHEDHADTNAAKVLMQRYTRRTGGEAACGGNPEKGPTKQEPKAVRSRTKALKRRGLKSLGLQAEDGLRWKIREEGEEFGGEGPGVFELGVVTEGAEDPEAGPRDDLGQAFADGQHGDGIEGAPEHEGGDAFEALEGADPAFLEAAALVEVGRDTREPGLAVGADDQLPHLLEFGAVDEIRVAEEGAHGVLEDRVAGGAGEEFSEDRAPEDLLGRGEVGEVQEDAAVGEGEALEGDGQEPPLAACAELGGDAGAHVVGDEVDLAEAEAREDLEHHVGLLEEGVAEGGRFVGGAKAEEVEGDERVAGGEAAPDPLVVMAGGGEAVEQEDGRAGRQIALGADEDGAVPEVDAGSDPVPGGGQLVRSTLVHVDLGGGD